jgi:CelD/BcsL family acetyltransferase involved in cellulose biosynthesis
LEGEVDRLEPAWRALAERGGNAFLTPEWTRCWLAHYGAGLRLLVPSVEGPDGSVRGVLPLALAESGRPRVCRIAGANLGDRFHPASEPGLEAEVAAAAGEALREAADAWSVVALDHVDLTTPWVDALAEATGVRLRRRRRPAMRLPAIALSEHGDWDAYLATRSSNFRQQLRRFPRRAASRHSVVVRRTERQEQVRPDMSTFFRLHDLRFGAAPGGSSMASERARRFHADFAAAALERGWLRLWLLEIDGDPAAAWYGWRVGPRYAYYNGGFDPAFSDVSPGLVLAAAVIESAFEEGAEIFEFLLGDESYKDRFADRVEEVVDVTLTRAFPHPASVLAAADHGARRTARLIPAGVRRRGFLARLARRSLLRGRGR